ncbi:response regulator transcription factor [Halomonas halodenitrificans]|uniref:response regulator transcription factor n=1 Tax=Halomonas halodenitrificans TaxID=28252 RepID=UPI0005BD6D6E|nr:response regulator [Halomonas halodenitrificans]
MDKLRGKKVLVVDDIEAERQLISTFLRHLGCRIYHAHDGLDGLHKARMIIPDAILMDFEMPNCNGLDSCKLLSRDSKTKAIPILFLSGYSSPSEKVKGLMAGAVDYIAKPFNFDEVKMRLSIHLKYSGTKPSCEEGRLEEGESEQGFSHSQLDEILFYSAQIELLKSLDKAPGLDELARLVGTNAKQLNISFKAFVGLTVYEYLREERMKEARKLLVSTGMPVTDVAQAVGFSTVGTFSTAFKERFETPPSRFRKLERLN